MHAQVRLVLEAARGARLSKASAAPEGGLRARQGSPEGGLHGRRHDGGLGGSVRYEPAGVEWEKLLVAFVSQVSSYELHELP